VPRVRRRGRSFGEALRPRICNGHGTAPPPVAGQALRCCSPLFGAVTTGCKAQPKAR